MILPTQSVSMLKSLLSHRWVFNLFSPQAKGKKSHDVTALWRLGKPSGTGVSQESHVGLYGAKKKNTKNNYFSRFISK